ncbi:hypothetical protein ACFWPK_04345 [Nocardia sp. NPDC058519]|uniref:hypothetical protein n=1 Tax=Nocardia sp. NPDC058519 TaxID=3346535 RepID=UPI00364FCC00
MSNDIRDIAADYERAYLDAYQGLVRANRADEADEVADVLAKQFKRDPRPAKAPVEKPQTAAEKKVAAEKAKAVAAAGAKETAAATPAHENTADTGAKE